MAEPQIVYDTIVVHKIKVVQEIIIVLKYTLLCLMHRDSQEAIRTLLIHLQRLIKLMNSKQVLEGEKVNTIFYADNKMETQLL